MNPVQLTLLLAFGLQGTLWFVKGEEEEVLLREENMEYDPRVR